jgi:prepilin-type processing-associated H-X9-DG protein
MVAFGGSFKAESGHTEWVDGRVHQTGMTALWKPNTRCDFVSGTTTFDTDFNSSREGATSNPTYAGITARSYHSGGVNVLFVDGSTRFINDSIDLSAWRGLATRAGGEVANAP